MQQEYELLPFGSKTPMKLYCYRGGDIERHWHSDLELFLVLRGPIEFICDDESVKLNDDDLFVINENSIHAFRSEATSVAISLRIETQKIEGLEKNLHFICNSACDNDKGRYYPVKRLIAELVKTNAEPSEDNFLFNRSIMHSLLFELMKNFRADKNEKEVNSKKYLDRLNDILAYINEHYREALTLNQLAETQHLSVPYLSSFFEKYLGVNFLTYYNELRLERATNELLLSDNSVEVIALNNGFTNPRSFVTLFKRKYGTLPSLYRKKQSLPPTADNEKSFYTYENEPDRESYLSILAKYLPSPSAEKKEEHSNLSNIKYVNKEKISILNAPKSLRHTFKVFTSVGRAKELLFADVQKMLTELQNDIGYEYIKFHGLLSDDMLVYEEDEAGIPHYSFVYIDKVIDFLLSIKLKPLIQFSFMPTDLASLPGKTVYASPFNISPPKDYNRWEHLIHTLMLHFIERYGLKTVRSWLFCVWNEPDTPENIFGFKNDEDFFRLYQITYRVIKNIHKGLRFGSPSLLVTYNLNQRWCKNFVVWCKENGCIPDFMNIHYYDNDFSEDSISQHRPAHPAHSRLNRDENSFTKCLANIKILFKDLGLGSIPVYLTEWNLTVSHRNLLNDTCFKSCYLTKNLLENYDELDSFGYWVLTDWIEETQPSKEQFHGGLGLFTQDGIKKPHYYAFDFMNKLGDLLIDKGNGYFITKSYGKIQIILYNYEHFNHLFASGETFDMTFTERYTPFSQLGKMEISLELIDIPVKECIIREHIINQTSGSAFDEWVRMGAPNLCKEDIEYLKQISAPRLFVRKETIENNVLPINVSLEPLEVRLIEISL